MPNRLRQYVTTQAEGLLARNIQPDSLPEGYFAFVPGRDGFDARAVSKLVAEFRLLTWPSDTETPLSDIQVSTYVDPEAIEKQFRGMGKSLASVAMLGYTNQENIRRMNPPAAQVEPEALSAIQLLGIDISSSLRRYGIESIDQLDRIRKYLDYRYNNGTKVYLSLHGGVEAAVVGEAQRMSTEEYEVLVKNILGMLQGMGQLAALNKTVYLGENGGDLIRRFIYEEQGFRTDRSAEPAAEDAIFGRVERYSRRDSRKD